MGTQLFLDTPLLVLRSLAIDPVLWGALLAGITLGTMLFFSAVMAPLIFTRLDISVASVFIRQVFPWYYAVGIILAALAAILLSTHSPIAATLSFCVAALGILARQILMPRINRASDRIKVNGPSNVPRFNRLHRLSVAGNGLQVVLMAGAFVLAFYRI